jgi:hypothetical protein
MLSFLSGRLPTADLKLAPLKRDERMSQFRMQWDAAAGPFLCDTIFKLDCLSEAP